MLKRRKGDQAAEVYEQLFAEIGCNTTCPPQPPGWDMEDFVRRKTGGSGAGPSLAGGVTGGALKPRVKRDAAGKMEQLQNDSSVHQVSDKGDSFSYMILRDP